jgi:hypothetical protein
VEGCQNNELSQFLPIDGQWGTGHDVEIGQMQVHEHVHHDNIINTMEMKDMAAIDAHDTGVEKQIKPIEYFHHDNANGMVGVDLDDMIKMDVVEDNEENMANMREGHEGLNT